MSIYRLFKQAILLVFSLFSLSLLNSCEKMEDTYSMYSGEIIYSPKVSALTAVVGLKTATISWTNPPGNLAKKITVVYDGKEVKFEEMVSTITLNDLVIKGYEISIFTFDAYGNRSVPATVYIFPSGEK